MPLLCRCASGGGNGGGGSGGDSGDENDKRNERARAANAQVGSSGGRSGGGGGSGGGVRKRHRPVDWFRCAAVDKGGSKLNGIFLRVTFVIFFFLCVDFLRLPLFFLVELILFAVYKDANSLCYCRVFTFRAAIHLLDSSAKNFRGD